MNDRRDEIVLCVNGGSSSLKLALFEVDREHEFRLASMNVKTTDVARAFADAVEKIGAHAHPRPTLVAHRVAHGGPRHSAPCRIDGDVLEDLARVASWAPLHQAAAIAAFHEAHRAFPELRQIAAFDTAFHAHMPEVAARLPLPEDLWLRGVRRYGFHGLSFKHVMHTLGPKPPARVVIAHLGSGSSVVAVRDGVGVDTTMGLTPAGGVIMGTRPGDLDPGALLYLIRDEGLSPDALEDFLFHRCGLAALGGTSDMRDLLERTESDSRARLAVDAFAYSVKKAIGSMAAVLGGVDVLVFTGGIGERSAVVRELVCRGLEAFGARLDDERNRAQDSIISSKTSRCEIRVVVADEERQLARHAFDVARAK